jgi:hypothetical protein
MATAELPYIESFTLPIDRLTKGAHPKGNFAEYVSLGMRNNLRNPASEWVVVNPPSAPSRYICCWLNPDRTSTRDLLYLIDTRHGQIFTPGAQVKTGDPAYIAKSLLKHAKDARYGWTCDVDARLVNPDGTPRIGKNAFSKKYAEKLIEAKFKFVGIEGAEDTAKRAATIVLENQQIAYSQEIATYERELIIRANYAPRQVAIRAGFAGGITFLIIAGAASYQQYSYYKKVVKEGRLEDNPEIRKEFTRQAAKTVAKQAAIGGGIVAASVVVEAGAFHVAENFMPAPKAQVIASAVVSAGYAGMDAMDEYIAYRSGEISKTEAITYGSIKAVMDGLPIAGQCLAGSGGAVIGMGLSTLLKWLLGCVRKVLT